MLASLRLGECNNATGRSAHGLGLAVALEEHDLKLSSAQLIQLFEHNVCGRRVKLSGFQLSVR